MLIERVTGRVLEGPLEPVYVYEAPVRLWHWVTMLCFVALAATGYLIGSPPPAIGGEAVTHFMFGYIRMIHVTAGYLLAVMFVVRVYWAIAGNFVAREIFVVQVWSRAWWKGFFDQCADYLFASDKPLLWIGHNPLAQASAFLIFVLGTLFMIATGFALYSQQWAAGTSYAAVFAWVFTWLGDPQNVRTWHHLGMWYLILFVMVHVYMVFREDIMSGESIVSTMINGIRMFKRAPPAQGAAPAVAADVEERKAA